MNIDFENKTTKSHKFLNNLKCYLTTNYEEKNIFVKYLNGYIIKILMKYDNSILILDELVDRTAKSFTHVYEIGSHWMGQ